MNEWTYSWTALLLPSFLPSFPQAEARLAAAGDDMDAEERESLEADVERLTKAARLAEVDAVGLLDKVKKSMPPAGGSMDAGDDEL